MIKENSQEKRGETAGKGIIHGISAIYLFMVACMVPLYMYDGYYGLSSGKFILYRNIGFLFLPILLFLIIGKGIRGIKQEERLGKSGIGRNKFLLLPEICLLLYGLCNILSFLLSPYKREGMFGAGGWYMGLFSQLSFLILYFYYAYVWEAEKEVVAVILTVCGFICVLAVLNRFGIWPVAFRGRTENTLSTIGNTNWLCGYLSVMMPAGMVLFWGSLRSGCRKQAGKQRGKIAAGLFTAAAFLCAAIQGSDSGLLVTGTVLSFLFLISCRDTEDMDAFWDVFLTAAGAWLIGALFRDCFPQRILYDSRSLSLIHMTIMVPVFLAALVCRGLWRLWSSKAEPEKCLRLLARMKKGFLILGVILLLAAVLFTAAGLWGSDELKSHFPYLPVFDEQWGNGRGGIWKECMDIWLSESTVRKLFGVGPDCLSVFLYTEQGNNPLLSTAYREAVLTNCHNEWMTILLNTGLAGLFTYVGFLAGMARRLLKKGNLSSWIGAAVLVTYTIHNMVSFQQITSTPLLFLILGLAWNGSCADKSSE